MKVIDGCALNGRYWVFAAATTDVGLHPDGDRHRDRPYRPLRQPPRPPSPRDHGRRGLRLSLTAPDSPDMLDPAMTDPTLPAAEILLRLCAATFVGCAVGLNRELHGKPAGMRTHGLVALGGALITLASIGIAGADSPSVLRTIQGVMAGIGFLGGGVILRDASQHSIHGLTTAATLWVVACPGDRLRRRSVGGGQRRGGPDPRGAAPWRAPGAGATPPARPLAGPVRVLHPPAPGRASRAVGPPAPAPPAASLPRRLPDSTPAARQAMEIHGGMCPKEAPLLTSPRAPATPAPRGEEPSATTLS